MGQFDDKEELYETHPFLKRKRETRCDKPTLSMWVLDGYTGAAHN